MWICHVFNHWLLYTCFLYAIENKLIGSLMTNVIQKRQSICILYSKEM